MLIIARERHCQRTLDIICGKFQVSDVTRKGFQKISSQNLPPILSVLRRKQVPSMRDKNCSKRRPSSWWNGFATHHCGRCKNPRLRPRDVFPHQNDFWTHTHRFTVCRLHMVYFLSHLKWQLLGLVGLILWEPWTMSLVGKFQVLGLEISDSVPGARTCSWEEWLGSSSWSSSSSWSLPEG